MIMHLYKWAAAKSTVLRQLACLLLLVAPLVALGQDSSAAAAAGRADLAATALLVTGIILLVLEIKLVSFGMLAVLGTACLAFATALMWRNGRELWGISAYYIVPLLLLILILTVMMAVLAARAHREKVTSGSEGFLGEIAVASEALAPEGRVFFQGTYWQAESRLPVAANEKVRIIGVERLKLYVEPAGSEPSPALSQGTTLPGPADGEGVVL